MDTASTEFSKFLAEEIKNNEGVLVPVRAGFLERMFVRKTGCYNLHPNPDDEFCKPSIGPNYKIISDYVKMLSRFKTLQPDPADEPLQVEKVNPDGYMILNGHHRWAAALMTGMDKVPISIVNLTQERDIEEMLRNSGHDRRVTLDLDEVIFCNGEDIPAEKPLSFPFRLYYKEKIRLGVPALLHFLSKREYDIWVYSTNYYSFDYIRNYFRQYSVNLTGVITGMARRHAGFQQRTEEKLARQYRETIHIDNTTLLRTKTNSKDFEEYPLNTQDTLWSSAAMEVIRGLSDEQ